MTGRYFVTIPTDSISDLLTLRRLRRPEGILHQNYPDKIISDGGIIYLVW